MFRGDWSADVFSYDLAFRVSAGDSSRRYDFGHVDLWKLRSGSCNTVWSRSCEVAVRYDADGVIYWLASSRTGATPGQPDGFPIRSEERRVGKECGCRS